MEEKGIAKYSGCVIVTATLGIVVMSIVMALSLFLIIVTNLTARHPVEKGMPAVSCVAETCTKSMK